MNWTKDAIVDELVRLHEAGVRVTHGELIDRHGLGFVRWASLHFGSISRAREAAGVGPLPPRRRTRLVRLDPQGKRFAEYHLARRAAEGGWVPPSLEEPG